MSALTAITSPLPSDARGRGRTAAATPGGLGDLGELYVSLSARLERIVRMDVRAPQPVIEDACQIAWGQLIRYHHDVRPESALSWLATTAIREALGLLRRQNKFHSLEGTLELSGEAAVLGSAPGADEIWELREELGRLATLSERQRRMLWLQGLGYSYREIAATTGCTIRTVERQLLRSKRKLRMLAEGD